MKNKITLSKENSTITIILTNPLNKVNIISARQLKGNRRGIPSIKIQFGDELNHLLSTLYLDIMSNEFSIHEFFLKKNNIQNLPNLMRKAITISLNTADYEDDFEIELEIDIE